MLLAHWIDQDWELQHMNCGCGYYTGTAQAKNIVTAVSSIGYSRFSNNLRNH